MSSDTIHKLGETFPGTLLWSFLAEWSEPAYILILGIFWLWWMGKRTEAAWYLPSVTTLGMIIAVPVSYTIRKLVGRERPFAAGDFEPLVEHAANSGFPSNHAVSTAVFAAVIWIVLSRRWGIAFALLALTVGWARVVTGLHYPGDLAAGWLLGGTAGTILAAYRLPRYAWLPNFLRRDETASSIESSD